MTREILLHSNNVSIGQEELKYMHGGKARGIADE